jgi:NAD(P)-dependent dehydrogenase (short-subunit alcohol dehydrogenase family)
VVLGDIRPQGAEVARAITRAGGRAVFEPLDVTSERDWERSVAIAGSEFGGLDILVNNAGILGRPGILETSLELWHEVIAVNQTGPFLGMRAAIPALRRRAGGSIVNISSALAEVGYGESASYTAAKGALSALTRTVAVELASEGIRVNVVHPGVIDTPMTYDAQGDDAEALAAQAGSAPIGRMGGAGEMAAAVLYLASDEASFVTGAVLAVDGGLSVW